MKTAADSENQARGTDWLAPLFGQAWAERPLDLCSDRIKSLAATGLLNPRRLSANEIQVLAASVMAHIVKHER